MRGLHYQLHHPQGKLVRVSRGIALDVAVDLRLSSPTFGKHVTVEISSENHKQLWIPPGFAHGFIALSESVDFIYKTTDYYKPGDEHCIKWNDLELNIDWNLDGLKPNISEKDKNGKSFCEAPMYR